MATIKTIVKGATTDATKKGFAASMSELNRRLERIETQLAKVDQDEHELRDYLGTKFDQIRDAIHGLDQRIASMEVKLEHFAEILRNQSARRDDWLERLVRAEMAVTYRPKKKAS